MANIGNEYIEGRLLSPNIGNYYVGKGIISIKLLGESSFTDCGNVPVFEFMAKVTNLDHYSSRTGVRVKDFTAVIEISGQLTMQMEELTARNMGFAMLGFRPAARPPSRIRSTFSDRRSSMGP